MKKLFSLFAAALMAVSVMGAETYQHVFKAKPATGETTLSEVAWTIEATNLGSYNSQNYAGVQIGSSKTTGAFKMTSGTWNYKSTTEVKEVRLWLNTGGSAVTPTVKIGGVAATSDGTEVVKNSGAGSDYTKATKVTFTPAENGQTGVIVIDIQSAAAGYVCAVEVVSEEKKSEPNAYLIGGGEALGDWKLDKAIPFTDKIIKELAAGVYEFKVLPTNTNWDGAMGYSAVNAECSSENVRAGGTNIHVALAEAGTLTIEVKDGKLCVTGSFVAKDPIKEWTIVGDQKILGSNWNLNDANNLMTKVDAENLTITKSNVELAKGDYKWKVVGDHSYSTEFPSGTDFILTIAEDGTYDIVFGLNINTGQGSAVATPITPTGLNNVEVKKAVKLLENGQIVIVKEGVRYNVIGIRK